MRYKLLVLIYLLLSFLFFKFPEDHSFHSQFGLEWIYFVGHLESKNGEKFGYELSFFRVSVRDPKLNSQIEIFPVHFALSSVRDKKHKSFEARHRRIGDLAGYSSTIVYSGEYQFKILNESKFHVIANPKNGEDRIDLILEAKSVPLIHGKNGISIKSPMNPSLFSYYYSYPRLKTTGTLVYSNKQYQIHSGDSWMDHEWSQKHGSNASIVSKDTSWDWLCLTADDGGEFVSFNFRSSISANSETTGIYRNTMGETSHFEKLGKISMLPIEKGKWRSRLSGITYPLAWKISFPNGFWNVYPVFNEQEFDGRKSTGIVYWEGMVIADGEIDGKKRTAKGYLELKGYNNSSKWWNL